MISVGYDNIQGFSGFSKFESRWDFCSVITCKWSIRQTRRGTTCTHKRNDYVKESIRKYPRVSFVKVSSWKFLRNTSGKQRRFMGDKGIAKRGTDRPMLFLMPKGCLIRGQIEGLGEHNLFSRWLGISLQAVLLHNYRPLSIWLACIACI